MEINFAADDFDTERERERERERSPKTLGAELFELFSKIKQLNNPVEVNSDINL